jgi:hypothetical protein
MYIVSFSNSWFDFTSEGDAATVDWKVSQIDNVTGSSTIGSLMDPSAGASADGAGDGTAVGATDSDGAAVSAGVFSLPHADNSEKISTKDRIIADTRDNFDISGSSFFGRSNF